MKAKPALLGVGAMLSLFSTIALAQTSPFNVVYNCNGVRLVVNSCLAEADDANCLRKHLTESWAERPACMDP